MLNYDGLPINYTNIRLHNDATESEAFMKELSFHDDTAENEAFMKELRASSVKWQIEQHCSFINDLSEQMLHANNDFKQLVNSDVRFGAFTLPLDRVGWEAGNVPS